MKTRDFHLFNTGRKGIFAGLLLLGFLSCKEQPVEPIDPTDEVTNTEINTWITDNMRDVYYWNTSIPANGSLNFDQAPLPFFETIRYKDDRFSWIQDADDLDDGLSGISTTVGLGITLLRIANDNVIILVRYALEGSPAALAGVKRGDIITRINGRAMDLSNYSSVMEPYYGEVPFNVQIAKLQGTTLVTDRDLSLTPVQRFQEKAVHLDTVIQTPNGKKVAYLFYNRFLNEQINDLVNVFLDFKQAGVDELVLDLRYNGGGGIFISGVLSGLIHKNFNENDVFISYQWNSNYRDDDYTYYRLFGGNSSNTSEKLNADNVVSAIKAANLGLDRVFVLTTGSTASASELVINNLRPFMSDAAVVQIGLKTMGKNQGSITIKDERTPRRISWGIQPIVVLLANKNGFGNYPDGLTPTFGPVNENEYLPLVKLGSTEEPLLNQALRQIDPSIVDITATTQMSLRSQRTRQLNVRTVEGFRDLNNPARPVDLGNTVNLSELHLKERR